MYKRQILHHYGIYLKCDKDDHLCHMLKSECMSRYNTILGVVGTFGGHILNRTGEGL